MHRAIAFLFALMTASSALAHDVATPDAARCAVWARELSFADAVAARDQAAFAEHLHPDAVFGVNDPGPTRGARAIAREWAGIVDGRAIQLAWYPSHVVASASGDLAWSTGPSLIRQPDGSAPRIGAFQSVWQRGPDGAWRVLFDGGTAPQPATAAQVAAFHAARQRACPAPDAPSTPG